MDESRFWSMIEAAWDGVDGQADARRNLTDGELPPGEVSIESCSNPSGWPDRNRREDRAP